MAFVFSSLHDECEYVDELSENLTCFICLGALCNPHLLSCCGIKYCNACINPIKCDNKPCPNCRAAEFHTMLDKNIQRAVNNLKVYCIHRKTGCSWTGEMMYLLNHVQNKCLHVGVACKYCAKEFSRQDIDNHETNDCDGRPLELRVMSAISSMNKRVEQLEKDCEYWKKEALSLRAELNTDHKQYSDSLEKIKSVFEEDRSKHQQEIEELEEAMLSMKKKSAKALDEGTQSLIALNECIPWAKKCKMFAENLERSNRDWQVPTWQTPPSFAFSSSFPPCQFIMKGFTDYRDSGEVWYSPPFYSWPGGHKLCLKVLAKGENNKYMSVGVIELAGEYDNMLHCPPQCIVKVSILNMLRNSNHVSHYISVESIQKQSQSTVDASSKWFTKSAASSTTNKFGLSPNAAKKSSSLPKTVDTTCGSSHSLIPKFISHASMGENPLINSKYWSENDCVCFRVDGCKEDKK